MTTRVHRDPPGARTRLPGPGGRPLEDAQGERQRKPRQGHPNVVSEQCGKTSLWLMRQLPLRPLARTKELQHSASFGSWEDARSETVPSTTPFGPETSYGVSAILLSLLRGHSTIAPALSASWQLQ